MGMVTQEQACTEAEERVWARIQLEGGGVIQIQDFLNEPGEDKKFTVWTR